MIRNLVSSGVGTVARINTRLVQASVLCAVAGMSLLASLDASAQVTAQPTDVYGVAETGVDGKGFIDSFVEDWGVIVAAIIGAALAFTILWKLLTRSKKIA